jgi:hypothetical protein
LICFISSREVREAEVHVYEKLAEEMEAEGFETSLSNCLEIRFP